mgnify:CR=1 FL=1
MKIFKALLAAALLPLTAAAHDYSTIEGGYVSVDRGRDDDAGFRFGFSAPLAPTFNLFGEYVDTGDFEQLSFGGQVHTPMANRLDFTAGVSVEHVDLGRVDDTGLGLRAGLRWLSPSRQFEVNPELRFVDVFDDESTSLRVAALATLNPAWALQGAVQGGDDDRFELGLRYNL